jgi:GH24 family phage-related lysozyme (muramidase)
MNLRLFIITIIFLMTANIFAQDKKSQTPPLPASLAELEGLWEVTKIEQPYGSADTSSVQQWLGKKVSISQSKIQLLDEFELYGKLNFVGKDCDTKNGVVRPISFQKYSKFDAANKDSLIFKADEKLALGEFFCKTTPFAEFLYIPKQESIALYSPAPGAANNALSSGFFVFLKKISKTPVATISVQSGEILPASFNFSDKAVDAIKELEAFRDHLYLDGNKNYIFGYGHLVAPNPQLVREGFEHPKEVKDEIQMFKTKYGTGAGDGTATQQEKNEAVDMYLRKDLGIIIGNMKKFITVPLSQNKIDAIVIYLFWRGSYANDTTTNGKMVMEFFQLVNAKNDAAVANFIRTRLKKDVDGKDIPFSPGHPDRHNKTATLYTDGIYANPWLW